MFLPHLGDLRLHRAQLAQLLYMLEQKIQPNHDRQQQQGRIGWVTLAPYIRRTWIERDSDKTHRIFSAESVAYSLTAPLPERTQPEGTQNTTG